MFKISARTFFYDKELLLYLRELNEAELLQISTVIINPLDLRIFRDLKQKERDSINLEVVVNKELLAEGLRYFFNLGTKTIKLMVNKAIQPGYFLAIIEKGELA